MRSCLGRGVERGCLLPVQSRPKQGAPEVGVPGGWQPSGVRSPRAGQHHTGARRCQPPGEELKKTTGSCGRVKRCCRRSGRAVPQASSGEATERGKDTVAVSGGPRCPFAVPLLSRGGGGLESVPLAADGSQCTDGPRHQPYVLPWEALCPFLPKPCNLERHLGNWAQQCPSLRKGSAPRVVQGAVSAEREQLFYEVQETEEERGVWDPGRDCQVCEQGNTRRKMFHVVLDVMYL